MKQRIRRLLNRHASLRRILIFYLIVILINAGLLTYTFYMTGVRTGMLHPPEEGPRMWPMLLVLLCIVIATVLCIGFSGNSFEPVHKVVEAMKKVSHGDFSVRLDEKTNYGEIHELITSYNHMVQELSSIEMFRKDFINNFSHEFKTPIVSIRGFAKQLEREDLTEEQRREYTRIIVSESERLANMSTNVLLLTKLENQQIITDKAPFRLDEQIRNCILLLEKQWEDKNLELNLELDELIYNGNEEMLSHVWTNLLSNAIKFSYPNGLLEVNCMRVQNFIVTSITDHGEGMDADTQARIFEKFYQGDTAHATEGNGLGLSLVKRIVELCAGKVTVISSPETGTTFSVYLPLGSDPV